MKNGTVKNIFILGISSDIGKYLAKRYLEEGHTVIGTYRNSGDLSDLLEQYPKLYLFACDVVNVDSISAFIEAYREISLPWDAFISCVGVMKPIGNFFSCKFDDWETTVISNFTSQLRVLHALYPCKRIGDISDVVFFAGGGTNSAFTNYSAYCLGKIALIKMCELLDDETDDLNVFALGTGWVKTKIHQQTLDNASAAGFNYDRTIDFLNSGKIGTAMEDIYDCIKWCMAQGRTVAGGRNFSIVHDPWHQDGIQLATWLSADKNRFKLRRQGNEHEWKGE